MDRKFKSSKEAAAYAATCLRKIADLMDDIGCGVSEDGEMMCMYVTLKGFPHVLEVDEEDCIKDTHADTYRAVADRIEKQIQSGQRQDFRHQPDWIGAEPLPPEEYD